MAVPVVPSTPPVAPTEPPGNGATPPLKHGDRLSREEFERRYDAMPDLKKAELIEGEVYMPSPVRQRFHGRQHSHLSDWLTHYEGNTPGVEVGDNSTVRLNLENTPQPDSLLFIQPEHSGQVQIGEDGYIGEVAASRASYDVEKKLGAYAANGVREYVVWRILDREIDWYVNRGGQFERITPQADGTLRSEVFPGPWLDPAAMMRGDVNGVRAVVQQGLNSAEHAEFVARLERDRLA